MSLDPLRLPKIWFLRHGQTNWNAERRIQGQLNSDLSAQGLEDAQAQARLLHPILTTQPACFVSPLRRTQQTADIALAYVPFVTDPRLSEAHAGAWQGWLLDDVLKEWPGLDHPKMTALELFLAAPGGEGRAAFQDRVLGFLAGLTQPSVLVGHGLWGQVMRGFVRGLSWDDTCQLTNEQGCIYVLENGAETVLREE